MSKIEVMAHNGRNILDGEALLIQGETLYVTDAKGKAVAVYAATGWLSAQIVPDIGE